MITLATFIAILFAQHFFYMHHIHKLLDKLMSRDYGAYVRARSPTAPRIAVADGSPGEPVAEIMSGVNLT